MSQTKLETLEARLFEIVTTIWTTQFDAEAPVLGAEGGGAGPRAISLVRFSGACEGQLVFACEWALAEWLAERLFGSDGAGLRVRDEVEDAVGEVANMVAGNLKSGLAGPTRLGPPQPQRSGTSTRILRGQVIVADLSFTSGGLEGTLRLTHPTGAAGWSV